MTERLSIAEWKAARGTTGNKYHAKRVVIDGFGFDSTLEAKRYEELKVLQTTGIVRWFLCQVPFRLPGAIIYRADFLIVWEEAHADAPAMVSVEDCKGAITRVSLNKIKQVEAIYGIKITLITRKGR
jgi:hypothetical protein